MLLRLTDYCLNIFEKRIRECNRKLLVYDVGMQLDLQKTKWGIIIQRRIREYKGTEFDLDIGYDDNTKWVYIAKLIKWDDMSAGYFGDHVKCLCIEPDFMEEAVSRMKPDSITCECCGKEVMQAHLIMRQSDGKSVLCCPSCLHRASDHTMWANALDLIADAYSEAFRMMNFQELPNSPMNVDAIENSYRPMGLLRSAMYVYDFFGEGADGKMQIYGRPSMRKRLMAEGNPTFSALLFAYYGSEEAARYAVESEILKDMLFSDSYTFPNTSDRDKAVLAMALKRNEFVPKGKIERMLYGVVESYRKYKPTKPIEFDGSNFKKRKTPTMGKPTSGNIPMDVPQFLDASPFGWVGYRIFEDTCGVRYITRLTDKYMPSEETKGAKTYYFTGLCKGFVEVNGEKHVLLWLTRVLVTTSIRRPIGTDWGNYRVKDINVRREIRYINKIYELQVALKNVLGVKERNEPLIDDVNIWGILG